MVLTKTKQNMCAYCHLTVPNFRPLPQSFLKSVPWLDKIMQDRTNNLASFSFKIDGNFKHVTVNTHYNNIDQFKKVCRVKINICLFEVTCTLVKR